MASATTKAVRTRLIKLALGLPGAFEDHPWGETVAKVGGKVFVFFGTGTSADQGFGFSVKLPQSSSVALMLPNVESTGYGLGKSGWVTVRLGDGSLPTEMFEEWILESYRAVAPKRVVKAMDEGGAPSSKNASAKKKAAPKKKAAAPKKKVAAPKKKAAAPKKKVAAPKKKAAAPKKVSKPKRATPAKRAALPKAVAKPTAKRKIAAQKKR